MSQKEIAIKDIYNKSLNLPERMSVPLWLLLNFILMPFSLILSIFLTAGNGADVATVAIDEAKKDAYLKYLMEQELSELLSAKSDKSLSRKSRNLIKAAIDKKTYLLADNKTESKKHITSEILISNNAFCIKASDLLKDLNLQAPDRFYDKSQSKNVIKKLCGIDIEKIFRQVVTIGDIDNVLTIYAPDYQKNPDKLETYISFVKKSENFSLENKEMKSGIYCYLTEQPEKGMHKINTPSA